MVIPPTVPAKPLLSRCKDGLSTLLFVLLWIPFKLMCVTRFIRRHFMAVSITILIVAVGYSPMKKMVRNVQWQTVAVDTLRYLGIIPAITYCDSNGDAVFVEGCTPCPSDARCHNGDVFCVGDKRLINGECKYDPKQIETLSRQMRSHSMALLARRLSLSECETFWLYNALSGTVEEERVGTAGMSKDELKAALAKALQMDATSHLFNSVFGTFTTHIRERNGEKALTKALKFVESEEVFVSRVPSTPWMCSASMFVTRWCAVLVPLSVLCLGLSVCLWRRARRRERLRKEKQRALDRKEDVVSALRALAKCSNQRWIPIVQLRAQVMGDVNAKGGKEGRRMEMEWKKVERLVDKDAHVAKSLKIVDGVQKLCWKLSDIALFDRLE